jgi:hypothetical protein
MEDLILKLNDMGLDSCWVTFVSSDAVKNAVELNPQLEVVAIAAFGYGKKAVRRLRLNLRSMSNVDIVAKHRYMEPKRSVNDLVYLETWGNRHDLERHIGFFDDMLWEALYAVSLAPSYLNRQAYAFLLHQGSISLVSRPDDYTVDIDGDLSLGIALLHFSAGASDWVGGLKWLLGSEAAKPELPEGHVAVASCRL